ncbi:MAG TPA: mannose-1-phosphate guanylyltransferase [Blastocatellia bacterium]
MFAIVMAGGSGTRFWPASRERMPKQFLRITSDSTLFEETLDRIKTIVADERVFIVVNRLHEETTLRLVGQSNARVLVEPVGRNTAPCIGLAAIHIARADENSPIVVLPSDHFIADRERFALKLRAAGEAARRGAIVTLGIPPTRPETGYGYIERGDETEEVMGEAAFEAKKFVEKPDLETALAYLKSGHHLWNSGIFIFTAKTILAEIRAGLPDLYEGLEEIGEAVGSARYEATVERVYPQLKAVSIDYGVMEKTAASVRVLSGDFGWSDVGSWQALYELRGDKYDESENLLLSRATTIDAKRNLVYSTSDRAIALLGVEGLVVVDTPDALMVADMSRSQDVKKFPEMLKAVSRTELS